MRAQVVIDVQDGYIEKYEDGLLKSINQRIADAKELQEHIVYIKNIKMLRSGKKTAELAKGLAVVSDVVFSKEQANAFACEELLKFLGQNNINEVEIIGVDGNSCVAVSAMGAKKLGYKVSMRLECIGRRNIERFQHTIEELRGKGIRMT